MSDLDLDYEGRNNLQNVEEPSHENPVEQPSEQPNGNEDKTHLPNTPESEDAKTQQEKETTNTNSTSLETGSIIEFDGKQYTVSENGDLVDETGAVFKEAKDVDSWIKEQNLEEDKNIISLESLQNALGIEITDDNDNPLTFDNTPQGITDYINAVIETSKDEVAAQTLESLFTKYPFLENAISYYNVNGSFEGFTNVKDRRSVVLDSNDESQQENIIRDAWKEDGRRGDVETYIKFLKSNDSLYETAKNELEALKAKDNDYFKSIKEESDRKAEEAQELSRNYWNTVKETIDKRQIGRYKIPESIIVVKDGKRTASTPDDFFKYVYQVDKDGKSRYQKDLEAISPEERLNDELIRAFVTYSGGNYDNLINMLAKEEKVKTVKYVSAKTPTSKVKVVPPKQQSKEIDFGY